MFKVIQGGNAPENQKEEKQTLSLEMFEAFAEQVIEIESNAAAKCDRLKEEKPKVSSLASLASSK